MEPIGAFTTAWGKSFTYGGKATRAEYWWFYLINIVVAFVILALTTIVGSSDSSSLVFVYSLAQVFPSISITVFIYSNSNRGYFQSQFSKTISHQRYYFLVHLECF